MSNEYRDKNEYEYRNESNLAFVFVCTDPYPARA